MSPSPLSMAVRTIEDRLRAAPTDFVHGAGVVRKVVVKDDEWRDILRALDEEDKKPEPFVGRFADDVKRGTRCEHERRWTDDCVSCPKGEDTARATIDGLRSRLRESEDLRDQAVDESQRLKEALHASERIADNATAAANDLAQRLRQSEAGRETLAARLGEVVAERESAVQQLDELREVINPLARDDERRDDTVRRIAGERDALAERVETITKELLDEVHDNLDDTNQGFLRVREIVRRHVYALLSLSPPPKEEVCAPVEKPSTPSASSSVAPSPGSISPSPSRTADPPPPTSGDDERCPACGAWLVGKYGRLPPHTCTPTTKETETCDETSTSTASSPAQDSVSCSPPLPSRSASSSVDPAPREGETRSSYLRGSYGERLAVTVVALGIAAGVNLAQAQAPWVSIHSEPSINHLPGPKTNPRLACVYDQDGKTVVMPCPNDWHAIVTGSVVPNVLYGWGVQDNAGGAKP